MPTAATTPNTNVTLRTTNTYLAYRSNSIFFHFYITVDIAGLNYNVVVWYTTGPGPARGGKAWFSAHKGAK